MSSAGRGPLGALAGVPGLTGALVRAAVLALVQTAGVVLLAAGLARAVADVAAGAAPGTALLVALAGAAVRAAAGGLGAVLAARDARRAEDALRRSLLTRLLAGEGEAVDAAFDVTVADASVSDYTLTVMTWVAGFGLPVVLGYQAWTYWVFRTRLTAEPETPKPEQISA